MKQITISDHTYKILMGVYRRYRKYYKSIDEFLVDLIDNYLMRDPEYIEEMIEWLAGDLKKKGVNVSIIKL